METHTPRSGGNTIENPVEWHYWLWEIDPDHLHLNPPSVFLSLEQAREAAAVFDRPVDILRTPYTRTGTGEYVETVTPARN